MGKVKKAKSAIKAVAKKAGKSVLRKVKNEIKKETDRRGGAEQMFSKWGATAGKWAWKAAKSFVPMISGFGEYHLNHCGPALGPPVFPQHPFRISKREFLGDVVGSTAFTLTQYPLNPGYPATFPWLSTIATSFEQYRIHGCVFHFRSTCGDALSSTNNALGTVVMATQYDALDDPFANKQGMEEYTGSISGKPSIDIIHGVECAPHQTTLQNLYVRGLVLPSDSDERMYDMGILNIATVGMQASTTVGELWVSYDVEFFKPKLPSNNVFDSYSFHAYGSCFTGSAFMYQPTLSPLNNLGVTLGGLTGNAYTTIIFAQPGYYLVMYQLCANNAQTVSGASVFTATSGCTIPTISFAGPSGVATRGSFACGSGTQTLAGACIVYVSVAGGYITNANTITVSSTCAYDVIVTPVVFGFTVPKRVQQLSSDLEKLGINVTDMYENYLRKQLVSVPKLEFKEEKKERASVSSKSDDDYVEIPQRRQQNPFPDTPGSGFPSGLFTTPRICERGSGA